jgi:hypothetical protein
MAVSEYPIAWTLVPDVITFIAAIMLVLVEVVSRTVLLYTTVSVPAEILEILKMYSLRVSLDAQPAFVALQIEQPADAFW